MRLHLVVAPLLLAGCAAITPVPETAGIDAVLIGEQHDAEAHPRIHERWVSTLAQRGALGAVTLEMAERGTSTAGLPRTASEAEVRDALKWNKGNNWPWERYGPAIMAAVRAGVTVLGGNLPREQLREAMKDETLDVLLPGPAMKAQQQSIRRGHCDMLPETQVQPMTRVQIARDVAMAQTISSSVAPGKTVVLLAGSGHVMPSVGVPQHLPTKLVARSVVLPASETGKDYCGEFRKQQEHIRHQQAPRAAN
jgi:uncharacterized iron-regulated protein